MRSDRHAESRQQLQRKSAWWSGSAWLLRTLELCLLLNHACSSPQHHTEFDVSIAVNADTGVTIRTIDAAPMPVAETVLDAAMSDDVWATVREEAAEMVTTPENQGGRNAELTTLDATVSERAEIDLMGDGDLWPSCWSDDGHLYAAWGDGRGFDPSQAVTDIGVAQIQGHPSDMTLRGTNLAIGDAVGPLWTSGGYSRKPTGMACIDGDLYLAVQELSHDFDDAPTATIARSRDKGLTWHWDRTGPMFHGHELTTIFFLDAGQDGGTPTGDPYVYAYALDGNWRSSYRDRVADPTRLWLARISRDAMQDRSRWSWFGGLDEQGKPTWSASSDDRKPVLVDERRIYRRVTPDLGGNVSDLSVLSQGGVVYNAPMRRYLYTSWTEYTFEFYQAPSPWGPFQQFLRKDFGGYPWSHEKAGGYATTIPSKFISNDGLTMYVQSNSWWGGARHYSFSMRRLVAYPQTETIADNQPGMSIPLGGEGAIPIGSSFRLGHPELLSDGVVVGQSEDSRTGEVRDYDFWGYVWTRTYTMNRIIYSTGRMSDCGWFDQTGVEVRNDGVWRPVHPISINPPYSRNADAGDNRTYVFSFATVVGSGIRLIGKPGGSGACTSIAEMSVEYQAGGI